MNSEDQVVMAIFFKAILVRVLMAVGAIGNGAARDRMIAPRIGEKMALPLSGVSLTGIVFLLCWSTLPFIGRHSGAIYWLIGCQWVCMTLLFELLLSRFILGKSRADILQVFSPWQGNLFLLVLAGTIVSPVITANLRGVLQW